MSWKNLIFVVLLWLLIGMQNHLHSILTHILRTAFLRFPVRRYSKSWPTCWAMRISDPRVMIVFVIHSILIYTPYLTCKQQVVTSNTGPNFGVPSNPTFWFRNILISWQSLLTTGHWICELWKFFSIFRHEILCDFNNIQESCIHTKCAQSVLLWLLFNSFSVSLQKKSFCTRSSLFKGTIVLITIGHKRGTRLSSNNGFPRSIMKRFTFFTHFCDCSVRTELIYKLIGRKKVVIVSWSAQ